jgi:hypothetical protein
MISPNRQLCCQWVRAMEQVRAPTESAYQSQAIDTSVESDRFFFHLLRQRSAIQRLMMGQEMMRSARQLSLNGLRSRFGNYSEREFARKVALAWLQEDLPPNFPLHSNSMTWIQDSIGLAAILHRVLTRLNVPYYITGGVAAITYGEPRTTRDLDIVMDIAPTAIDLLVAALEVEGFYVPGAEDVRTGRMRTLGITHIESISRADLVLAKGDAFDRSKFQRIRPLDVPGLGTLNVASPEDVILAKLLWGRQSQSEKQWRDVLGVLKVQGDALDFVYLNQWAAQLGLTELLDRAIAAAGL